MIGRADAEGGIFLIGRMRTSITIVLLSWMRVGINLRFLAEHLPIRFVFSKTLEICDLVLDLRLDLIEAII